MKFELRSPFQIIRRSTEAATERSLADSPAFKSGRLVMPTGGEYYQLLPKLSPVQIRAWLYAWLQGDWTSGYDLMQVMLDTWPRARKNLHEVREAAACARFTIHPAALEGEEPTETAIERADFVRRQLGRFNPEVATDEKRLSGFLYDATDALVMGVSLNEVLWDRHADGSAFVRATAYVTPRRIGYTASHKLGLRYPNTGGIVAPGFTPSPGPAQELEALRFILAQYQTCSGAATKQSILRTLVWWWGSMIWGRDWMLKFAEQFGLPWVDVAYDRNINPTQLQAMKAGAEAGGVNTHIFHPTDATVKLIESQKNGKDNPQMAMIEYADQCADLVILGQTGTGDAKQSSGRAQVTALAGIRRERVQAVANWLGTDAGAQLCGLITEVNYGDREEAPLLKADFTEPEQPLAMAERDQVIVQTVPVPKNWYYLRHNIPVPKAGEETIGGVPSPESRVPSPGKPADIAGAAAAETKVETELDAMRARLAALEAGGEGSGRYPKGSGGKNGSHPEPKEISIEEADARLTKGETEKSVSGKDVHFGLRMKNKLESDPSYLGRKKLLEFGQDAVRSGVYTQHVDPKNGELKDYYAKTFQIDGKHTLVVVSSKDGEAFNVFRPDLRYLSRKGYLGASNFGSRQDEQPSPGILQACAVADCLPDWLKYISAGENVNLLEAATQDSERGTQDAAAALVVNMTAQLIEEFRAAHAPLIKRLKLIAALHDPDQQLAELQHIAKDFPQLAGQIFGSEDLAAAGTTLANGTGAALVNALAHAKQTEKTK